MMTTNTKVKQTDQEGGGSVNTVERLFEVILKYSLSGGVFNTPSREDATEIKVTSNGSLSLPQPHDRTSDNSPMYRSRVFVSSSESQRGGHPRPWLTSEVLAGRNKIRCRWAEDGIGSSAHNSVCQEMYR